MRETCSYACRVLALAFSITCGSTCLSSFPSHPQTSEAAEKCLNEKRKTINGEDILTSMRALGFDNYEGVLKVYLAKYREVSSCSRARCLALEPRSGMAYIWSVVVCSHSQHQITQARLRQNQPVGDDDGDMKRSADDDDGAARKKARGPKRRDE